MTYVWRRPDQTRVRINSAQPISNALGILHSQWSAARERGDRLAEASLYSSHFLQREEWRRCQEAICKQEIAAVDEMIGQATARQAWWNERASPGQKASGPSPAQEAIFGKCDDNARPHSWLQAAFALMQLPEFRVPAPEQMEDALRANGELLIKAKAFRNALGSMVDTLNERTGTQAQWDFLQQLATEYDQAVRNALG